MRNEMINFLKDEHLNRKVLKNIAPIGVNYSK